jgi:hypothetical protein
MYSDVLYSLTIGLSGRFCFCSSTSTSPKPFGPFTEISDPVRRWRGDPAQIAAYGLIGVGRAHNDPLVIASFCGSDLQRNAP